MARAAGTAVLAGALAIGTVPSAAADPTVGRGTAAAGAVDAERTGAYVEAVYEDLFGRTPDAAGTSYWTRALLGGTPRDAVANSITSSEEFRSGLIADAYDEFLGRRPDAGGLRFWLDQMAHGMTIARMESGFIASDEFWAQSGGTASGWVTDLYAAVLGRDASPAEVAYWAGRTSGPASRGQVALGFLLSTERLTTVVNGYYQWLLGRDLDPSGQATWVAILQAGGRDEAIIGGIVGSQEYWDLVSEPVEVAALKVVVPGAPIPSGTAVTVGAMGLDADGQIVVDLSDLATFAVDGDTGLCQASVCRLSTSVGSHTISAAWGDLSAAAPVDVIGRLSYMVAGTPDVITAGVPFTVTLSGYDVAGNRTPLSPDSIDVDGGAGTCAGAVCTLTTADYLRLNVKYGTWGEYVYVRVLPGPFARLDVQPANATVTSGAGQEYRVRGVDAYGNSTGLSSPITVTIDGATCPVRVCAATGLGSHTVLATSGAATASTTLTVVAPGPTASRVFGWGAELYLGNGADGFGFLPMTRVGVDTHWSALAGGGSHVLGLTSDGALWAWGDNTRGELGDGTREESRSPRRIGSARWVAVAAKAQRSAGIQADGSLWVWGAYQEMGVARDVLTPTKVGTRTDWTAVTTTGDAVIALAGDGSLWAWGSNRRGALGDGSGLDTTTPVRVAGGHQWRAVSASPQHVLAIATDGSLWAWGANDGGQLGDGTTTDRWVPTRIGTGTSWATVSAGGLFSVATRTDHTMWTWGVNGAGRLGTGDTADRLVPTQVGAGRSWAAAWAGGQTTYAITTGGELWGWGSGSAGLALATGSSGPDRLTPERIGTDSGWTAVADGPGVVFALRP
jgi:hypothetical protein